jgi:hypothetical protein
MGPPIAKRTGLKLLVFRLKRAPAATELSHTTPQYFAFSSLFGLLGSVIDKTPLAKVPNPAIAERSVTNVSRQLEHPLGLFFLIKGSEAELFFERTSSVILLNFEVSDITTILSPILLNTRKHYKQTNNKNQTI